MEKTIYLVANSHIDPVWLWDKYEGVDEVINTFRAACDRLDEYPTLKFTASSVCFLKWTRHFAPEVFSRIRAYVAAGRWEIAGGWWIEPDCNLPTAESFHKSAEISRKFLREHFPDLVVEVGYCVDSFGHAASLPAILAEQGLKYYLFCRPDEREKPDLPANLFYWEFAGRRVLCYRLRYHYTQGLRMNIKKNEAALADEDFLSQGLACHLFGVGDHGGGPTRREIEYWQRKQAETKHCRLRLSTCREFFQAAERLSDIPVYQGDLHPYAVGCYSVNRGLKHAIRTAERALDYAGRVNRLAGRAVDLDLLWEKTIFNQFHDIMPGSCAPDAVRQALGEMGGVLSEAEWQAYEGLKRLAGRAPARCRQGEFRIVNTLDHPVRTPFEIESWLYFREGAAFCDGQGRPIPIQRITPSVICANRRWLMIDTLPAWAEKSYYFDGDSEEPAASTDLAPAFVPGDCISRGGLSIQTPGTISLGPGPLLKAPFQLAVIPDASDTWGHGVRGFGRPEGHFELTESAIDVGPLASTLVMRQIWGRSMAEMAFRIYDGLPFVDMFINVRWMEERRLLKLVLEPATGLDHVIAQGPGAAWRKQAQGVEEPLHGWLLAAPIGLAQDGAFAFDWSARQVRLTLVRSNLYAYDAPQVIDPRGPLRHTDLGEHHFRLRLVAAEGLEAQAMDRLLAEFNEPFRVLRQNG